MLVCLSLRLLFFLCVCLNRNNFIFYFSDDQFRERKYESDEEESPNLFCPLCAQKFGYSFGLGASGSDDQILSGRNVRLRQVRMSWYFKK